MVIGPSGVVFGMTAALDKRPSRRVSSNLSQLSGTGLERRFSEPDWNVNHPSRRTSEIYEFMFPLIPGVVRNFPRAESGLCVSTDGKVSQTFQDRPPASVISLNAIRHNPSE